MRGCVREAAERKGAVGTMLNGTSLERPGLGAEERREARREPIGRCSALLMWDVVEVVPARQVGLPSSWG